MSARKILLYDTTLRDGAQSAGVDFSLSDKQAIAHALDSFGIDYIEGGWPGANPIDDKFFASPPSLSHARLSAFGMTRRAGRSASNDPALTRVLESPCPCVCLVGKSSRFHAEQVLSIDCEENLRMISESCAEGARRSEAGEAGEAGGREVLFDAEHFFDGYQVDSSYALSCLAAALRGGAKWIVLCDTNGGTLPFDIERIVAEVRVRLPSARLGIHTHDDTGNGVANALAAVRAGVDQVQGTLNGLGERCGNANLVSIIPTLMLKMGLATSVSEQGLRGLMDLSRLLDSRLNRNPQPSSPYVGSSAFTHKGGLHGSGVAKHTAAYEHIPPERVGNSRTIAVSSQAGRANVRARLQLLGFVYEASLLDSLLRELKARETEGFSYEDAEASFVLLALRAKGETIDFFTIERFRVMDERRWNALGEEVVESEAVVCLKPSGLEQRITAAVSTKGPINALDRALRQGLADLYPNLARLRLTDYRVRIIPPEGDSSGTEATTRVLIDFTEAGEGTSWTTVGVSPNIIVASLRALEDSYRYMLYTNSKP